MSSTARTRPRRSARCGGRSKYWRRLCGANGLSDVVVQIDRVQVEKSEICLHVDPVSVTFEAPVLATIDIRERNFPLGTLDVLYAPNTLPSTPLVGPDLRKHATGERGEAPMLCP